MWGVARTPEPYSKVTLGSTVPWFKHACFLSYRHGQRSLKQRFIREFHDALSAELELLRNEDVYVAGSASKVGISTTKP
jgi:hypothetical protein